METKETLMKKMSDCVFEMEDEEVQKSDRITM